jgi:nitroreductase
MMQNCFSEAMDYRHACKIFDEAKKLNEDELHFILEAGRKSPSSFGMEPWKFLVISDQPLKEKLRPLCWNQPQITTCSHLVIILAAIENVKPESGIPQQRFARRHLPQEQIDTYINLYTQFMAETFSSNEKTFCWTARQTYIALANMMTGAASIGIDSCPIEGFEKEKVEAMLDIDPAKWQISVLVTFGHRVNPQLPQIRLPFEEVVKFVNA